MTLLVQITDTHIVERGKLLYGMADTARHLSEAVSQINSMRPSPDLVLITGDLVEHPGTPTYSHFHDLIAPLDMPVYLMPGNHDDPTIMSEFFRDTKMFPGAAPHYQYAIEGPDFRTLMLNSHYDSSELPCFGPRRLQWLQCELERSDQPTLVAIHHPMMKTGVEFIDMAGTEWFRGIGELLKDHSQVIKVICGHGHFDLSGMLGAVPVQMSGATAHQLIAGRVVDIAPSFDPLPAPPMLHHWISDTLVSGYYPWPTNVDAERIDKSSNVDWEDLKDRMRGSMVVKKRR